MWNNKIRKPSVYLMPVVCLFLFLLCPIYAQSEEEIKVVAAEYKPFVFYENEKLVGFDIDLLDIICRANNLRYSIQLVSFQEMLNMLRGGKADIGIGAVYVTAERKRFINFTTAYLKTGLVYVIRSDAVWDDDLSNQRIGVKRLATGETIARKLSERFHNLLVVPFESTEESIDALIGGRVDLVINDYLNTESLMHDRYRGKIKIKRGFIGLPDLLTHDEIAIAISKKRPDLLEDFDKTIRKMKKSGMLESVLDHWLSIYPLPDFGKYSIYIFIGIVGVAAVTFVFFRSYRKRLALQALQENEERYRAITEQSPSAIVTADSRGVVVLANNSTIETFGYSRDELIGASITNLMPELLRESHITGLERFLKTGKPQLIGKTFETIGRRKDGTEFPIELYLSTWQARDKVFFTGIINDISERKAVEERLIEGERRFRSVIENAPNPVVIHYYDGDIAFVNRSFVEITGYNPDEINTFERFAERAFPDPEYRDRIIKRYKEILLSDNPIIHGEDISITCSDGSVRIWNMQSSPIGLWGKGKVIMCVARDVTEHRMLEEQLRQAQKMEAIGRFTSGIAHDFNNYLTAIIGFSQLALMQLGDHPSREYIENVLGAAEKASGLTTQLLAFSRRQILRPEVVNLNDIISDMTKMISRIIGEDIELRLMLDPLAWNTKADPGQIGQVIMNLVSNARDAMPEGGVLTIQTSNVLLDEEYARWHVSVIPGEYVMMAIEDTGIGMTEEVKAHIFEPFFTTKEFGKGTGLGLATVYGIVKQSGGNIWVYSEPREGTTFKIYLPRTEEEKSIRKTKEIAGLPMGNEVILVVEDNREVREFITKVLKELGYNTFEASDGVEALSIVKDKGEGINLILTDVMMPHLRGDRLAERIKEDYPSIKILFMSGYADNIITKNGILKEGINYLQKPLTAMTLAQTVRMILDSQG